MIGLPGEADYRRLFAAYVLGLVGTGVAVVALTLLAFDIAGEDGGHVVAGALTIKSLAYVLVAPVAAAAAGRIRKQPFLIALDLVRAVALLALPLAASPAQVYLVVLVFTAAAAAFTVTYQALKPHLLPDRDDYARALAKSRVASELENGVSPLLAAAILLAANEAGLFAAAMAAFLVSAVILLGARLPDLPAPPRGLTLRRVLVGPRLLAAPGLRWILALHLVAAAGTAMVLVNTVVLVQGDLGLGPRASVAALAVFGVGAAAGALAMPALIERLGTRRTMRAGCVLIVAGLLAGAWLAGYAMLLGLWAMIGVGASLAATPTAVVLRRTVPARRHAAAYAAAFAGSNAALVLAYQVAAWAGDSDVAHRGGFLALGLLAAAAASAAFSRRPEAG